MGQSSSRSTAWLKDMDMYKGFNIETCQKIWNQFDTNHSGLLEYQEALAFCHEYCNVQGIMNNDRRNHIISSFFKAFDVNADGSISWEELYGVSNFNQSITITISLSLSLSLSLSNISISIFYV
jgi:Ca2+-binding EF-hand superfamily protein